MLPNGSTATGNTGGPPTGAYTITSNTVNNNEPNTGPIRKGTCSVFIYLFIYLFYLFMYLFIYLFICFIVKSTESSPFLIIDEVF